MAHSPAPLMNAETAARIDHFGTAYARVLVSAGRNISPRVLERGAIAVALLSIPLILMAVSNIWIANRYGDPDTWFYHGHFMSFLHKSINLDNITFDYYKTRLPYIIPGSLAYFAFGGAWSPTVFSVFLICDDYRLILVCLVAQYIAPGGLRRRRAVGVRSLLPAIDRLAVCR